MLLRSRSSPKPPHLEYTLWVNKPVRQTKLLEGAETLDRWEIVNTDEATRELALTTELIAESSHGFSVRQASGYFAVLTRRKPT